MPLLHTALVHFDEDILRAREIVVHSQSIAGGHLKDDLLRSAWMFAVGASDAYFSDAYADLLSRVLRAKEKEPGVDIPDRLANLKIPAIAVIRPSTGGWRWRMAARELIEDQNVLSLEKVRELFNQFCNIKPLNKDTVVSWFSMPGVKHRHFGITTSAYNNLTTKDKEHTRKNAMKKFSDRFEEIFQRRHDCIHNCDRPKTALQPIREAGVTKIIEDIEFFVKNMQVILQREFPAYLQQLGFNAVTRNNVLQ